MSSLDAGREWHQPAEHRCWPSVESISRSLESLGLVLEDVELEPLGARTIAVRARHGSRERHVCLVRQRSHDRRVVCALAEEYEALRGLYAASPGLVPCPIGLIEPAAGDPLLALSWIGGKRVGSLDGFRQQPEEIASTIAAALASFHAVGRLIEVGPLSRQVRIDRLLAAAGASPLRESVADRKAWDRTVAVAQAATRALGPPLVLHGDAHAYNLMKTADGGICWLDFERLAVGPAEVDNARAWVLLQAQAQREVVTPWLSEAQLACNFLAATNFLEAPAPACTDAGRGTVHAALRALVRRLQ